MATDPFETIIGSSAAAQAMRSFGRRAAGVDAAVLLLGESGTGKGVLARAIHRASARAARPFVAVNCAAVPETLFESEFFGHVRGAFTGAQYAHRGLFEQAEGGTLFLDEIGELAPACQAKLLTALDDRQIRRVGSERSLPFHVRIISATSVDVVGCAGRHGFRIDLLHRLGILRHHIAPLRQRNGDLGVLAAAFLRQFAARHERACSSMADATLQAIYQHPWSGNVRELANVMESAVLYCDGPELLPQHLQLTPDAPPESRPATSRRRYAFAGNLAEERLFILQAIARCRGNKSHAAVELGMSRNTLHNKLRQLGEAT